MASYYIVDDNVTIISHLIHLFKNVYRFTCSLKITCGQSWDTPVIPTLKKAEAGLSGIQSQPGLCGTLSQLSSSKTKEREKKRKQIRKDSLHPLPSSSEWCWLSKSWYNITIRMRTEIQSRDRKATPAQNLSWCRSEPHPSTLPFWQLTPVVPHLHFNNVFT